jgi:Protein phosphatase inhibitor 2 (IPP-2)
MRLDALNLGPDHLSDTSTSSRSSSQRRVSLPPGQLPYYQTLISSGTEWSSDSESDTDSAKEAVKKNASIVGGGIVQPHYAFGTASLDVIEHFDSIQDKLKHEEFLAHRQAHYNMKRDLDQSKSLLQQESDDSDSSSSVRSS